MGFDELLSVIHNTKSIMDHPDWGVFADQALPEMICFYYTNKEGDEAYWDNARIIKLDIQKMILLIEGTHGTPLQFDIFKIQHCKDVKTGKSVQEIFFDLIRMWKETYEPEP